MDIHVHSEATCHVQLRFDATARGNMETRVKSTPLAEFESVLRTVILLEGKIKRTRHRLEQAAASHRILGIF